MPPPTHGVRAVRRLREILSGVQGVPSHVPVAGATAHRSAARAPLRCVRRDSTRRCVLARRTRCVCHAPVAEGWRVRSCGPLVVGIAVWLGSIATTQPVRDAPLLSVLPVRSCSPAPPRATQCAWDAAVCSPQAVLFGEVAQTAAGSAAPVALTVAGTTASTALHPGVHRGRAWASAWRWRMRGARRVRRRCWARRVRFFGRGTGSARLTVWMVSS